MEGRIEGLRERKKRAAREGIATAARRLFAERGFDAVTVAEIAAAADVSEKTVFNHFATKEELAFAERDQRLRRLLADLAQRPAGTSVLDVFRATTDAMIDELDRDLAEIVEGSRALQVRVATGWVDELEAVTAAIAETTGAGDADVLPAVVAGALAATHRTVLGAARAGADTEALRASARRAYDQIAAGLGDYGGIAPTREGDR